MVLGWRRRRKPKIKPIITNINNIEIPSHFVCPISLDLMRDPVTVSTGVTYDRHCIDTWLELGNFTCPVTNQTLRSFDAVPNHSLRRIIQDWCTLNHLHRIPTPRVPADPGEVSAALRTLEASARRLDARGCADSVARLRRWGAEGERNRRCIAVNGAVNALAVAFDSFAAADHHSNNNYYNNNNNNDNVCREILSALSWMAPFVDGDECMRLLGSEPSLRCMVRFLSQTATSVSAAAVLEELIATVNITENLAKIEGLAGTLTELVRRSRACPKTTECSLSLIRILFLSDDDNNNGTDEIRSEFLEMGLVSSVVEILVESEKDDVAISERCLGVIEGVCGSEKGRRKAYENCLTIPVLVKKMLGVSDLAIQFSVSALWKLLLCDGYSYNVNNSDGTIKYEDEMEVTISNGIVEALKVGAFQKLLLIIQVGRCCGDGTKEKVTDLLKLLNPFRPEFEFIESVDFKSLQRSF